MSTSLLHNCLINIILLHLVFIMLFLVFLIMHVANIITQNVNRILIKITQFNITPLIVMSNKTVIIMTDYG